MKRSINFCVIGLVSIILILFTLFSGCAAEEQAPLKFIAMGSNGAIFSSNDGASWTDGSLLDSVHFNSVALGNGRLVAVGSSGVAYYSDNGVDWTDSSPGGDHLSGVAYGNNRFVSVGATGVVRISLDGTWWSGDVGPGGSALTGIAYGNGVFITVGYSGVSWYSEDGVNWTNATIPLVVEPLWNVTFVNGRFMAISGSLIYMSYDGSWWSDGVGSGGFDVTYGNGRYVTVGGNGSAYYSLDGLNWVDSSPGTGLLLAVVFNNDRFVAVGSPDVSDPFGSIWYSSDGIHWTDASPGPSVSFSEVISIP